MVKIVHEELFAGMISIPNTTVKFLSLGTDSEQTDLDQYKSFRIKARIQEEESSGFYTEIH